MDNPVTYLFPLSHMHPGNISVSAEFDALDYQYAHYPAASQHMLAQGERRLWCRVIEQAFEEAFGMELAEETCAAVNSRKYAAEALRWLLYGTKDFATVCGLAGVSPALIRSAAIACAQTSS